MLSAGPMVIMPVDRWRSTGKASVWWWSRFWMPGAQRMVNFTASTPRMDKFLSYVIRNPRMSGASLNVKQRRSSFGKPVVGMKVGPKGVLAHRFFQT